MENNSLHHDETSILPLSGVFSLPSLAHIPLEHHIKLGANATLVNITEEDFLYRRENIPKVFSTVRDMGLRAIANAWGYGGLFGGEALSASSLHRRVTGENRYLNSVYNYGPDADTTNSDQAITDSPAFQLKRMQEVAASAGADTWFYDEFKIQREGKNEPDHVPLETFLELAQNAHSLGMRNSLCVAVSHEEDTILLERIAATNLIDEVSFTRYYSPGHYEPAPDEYLGEIIERIKTCLANNSHPVRLLGWIQGFDLPEENSDIIKKSAEAWRSHEVHDLGIWGGYCVNDTPMLTPAGYGSHYDAIAEVFGGENPVK